jgi:hypothetical protein
VGDEQDDLRDAEGEDDDDGEDLFGETAEE